MKKTTCQDSRVCCKTNTCTQHNLHRYTSHNMSCAMMLHQIMYRPYGWKQEYNSSVRLPRIWIWSYCTASSSVRHYKTFLSDSVIEILRLTRGCDSLNPRLGANRSDKAFASKHTVDMWLPSGDTLWTHRSRKIWKTAVFFTSAVRTLWHGA